MEQFTPADTTDFSSQRKFCAIISTSYLLRFYTFYFEWCLHGFNVLKVLQVVCLSSLQRAAMLALQALYQL